VALIDAAAPPGISIPIWDLINDAFPANGNSALIPAGFDTCAAQVRIGLNIAAGTGNTLRPAITGDSVIVTAGGGNVRLDMVFRILPGPGNYVTTGSKASGVAKRPDVAVKTAATPGDGTFFGSYMASTGAFGSQATHPSGGTVWSQHVWNSARLDTIEINLFPTGTNAAAVGLAPGVWAGMYNELDPKFATLGITKSRCVMVVPGGATNSTNILCDGSGWGAYGAGSGWDGSTTTKEYTKIIPDGLLTPGSHVEYFFRKCDVSTPTVFEMGPDTTVIFQPTEGSNDGHRWQEFGVLPDRWKDGAWSIADRNAPAPACMLYVDWEDRRGDERFWVGIADSIGATAPARYGAHNGWHARGDQDITVAIATDPTIAVYTHGGQPGTIWDMYGVKASESSTTSPSLGSRSAASGPGLQVGKSNLNGPSGDMLRNYYRVLLILTGDLAAGNIGPYTDKGDNDVGLLQDFAAGVAGTTQPRAVWVQGREFVEGQVTGAGAGHPTFPTTYFGAGLASGDYRSYAGNTRDIIDLIPNAPIVTNGDIYGVLSNCNITDDVLSLSGSFGAAVAAKYEDSATNPNPKISTIYAPSSLPGTTHPMVTLVDGFRIQSLGGRNTLTSLGAIQYYYNVITNLFGSLNCLLAPGQPVGVGENPNQGLVNFLALRSENPFRSDKAKISFGITRKEKVELKVYDVTGRLVKTLANREFDAGSHDLFWDGTNDDGSLVSRGVYFYQLRTPSFVSQKKLAVLKN
jgi:flagellar hook capping protein FlgD